MSSQKNLSILYNKVTSTKSSQSNEHQKNRFSMLITSHQLLVPTSHVMYLMLYIVYIYIFREFEIKYPFMFVYIILCNIISVSV